jgi:hypothetical protein
MGKLFGTDGIRGVVNRDLDAMIAFRVGMAAAIVMGELKHGRTTFTIGRIRAYPRICWKPLSWRDFARPVPMCST